ncbi:DUF87 domain-containing protein [Gordonia sp. NPDC003585]|uniref:helicase HerA domain-containing protein n=1 Tax=Gordonia sp. NPDC003585 TaxID=3154275 RepID=UPI0033A572C8
MDNGIRRALEAIRLDWADTPDDVWGAAAPYHVGGLHEATLEEILRAFGDARRSVAGSPIGVAVRGPAGSGKTHLLGQVRERVHTDGGYFFLVKLLDGSDFWKSVVIAILEDLSRPTPTHRSQLNQLLDRLARDAEVGEATRRAVTGSAQLTPDTLDDFVHGVYTRHSRHRRRSQHILRALVLLESDDFATKDLGEAFLHLDVDDVDELAEWGIRNARLGYQEIAENISRIVAFDDAAVLAIDQIDTLIEAGKSALPGEESIVEKVAHGLMQLRDTMSRTVSVVSSITAAWEYLEGHVMRSAIDRFRLPPTLQRPTDTEFGRLLLTKRFTPCFDAIGFTPPFPTWPVTDTALSETDQYTPRELMMSVDRQIAGQLRAGNFSEITSLAGAGVTTSTDQIEEPLVTKPPTDDVLGQLDRRYAELIKTVDPAPALAGESEDHVVPPILQAGLAAWIEALPDDTGGWHLDAKPSPKAVLHARIKQVIDPHRDIEQSWSFRAIAATNARAVQTRLQNATNQAGLSLGGIARTLVILRREAWPSGPKTASMVNELDSRGGLVVAWSQDDIRALMALAQLRSERSPHLHEWIVARRPVDDIKSLATVLTAARESTSTPTTDTEQDVGTSETESEKTSSGEATSDSIVLGRGTAGDSVVLPLAAMRKHTAIFAGSGSGKTVLIRRIVEEAALHGVSSIVLDINNDLARLGVPWSDGAARQWAPGDRELAHRYFADTEVAVFTPGRNNGRPLSFRPLPDFSAIAGDSDEFDAAVDAAVAAIAPRARIAGRTAKATRSEAVLRQAMNAFGRRGGGSLESFIAMLSELPENVSTLAEAPKLAVDLAENLKASMANDPVFGGDAAPADPGYLLTPTPGFRARISVINLAGLGTGDRAASFVNQLQMALFAWIRKNPATDRPLGGLLVMDEAQNFAPAPGTTAATQSTLALASQARKYGLGLIFATQSPTGIHNRISGNASTQFFGLLNHPTQVAAAKELASRKGSNVSDVGRLPTGTFYSAIDGGPFVKVETPLCLSYHPQSPPTEDEVIEIARRSAR